jgi:hypothetical protein
VPIKAVERVAYGVGAALMLSGLLHVLILVAAEGSWAGPLSLRKPAAFGLSFGLTLINVTLIASLRHRRMAEARPRPADARHPGAAVAGVVAVENVVDVAGAGESDDGGHRGLRRGGGAWVHRQSVAHRRRFRRSTHSLAQNNHSLVSRPAACGGRVF